MDAASFEKAAHELVEWMVDYLATIESHPVRSQVDPGETANNLPASAPIEAEEFNLIFDDFRKLIVPGITHWQHPRFFAYFPANSSPPSILAEMLTATLAAQCMLWQTSPAATELETRVLDWLRQMLGLPEGFAGVIQDTASAATLCAVVTARERVTEWQANEHGLANLPKITFYTSTEAHSSIEKAVKIAGCGRRNVRAIETDDRYAMSSDALDLAISQDIKNGARPACVIATLGTTGVGSIDPLRAIGDVCKRHGVYLHVDAAWAGSALILPEQRWMLEGIEAVDSFAMNPHKWLMTNFDCTAHFMTNPDELIRTFSMMPSYLVGRETGQVTDYRDWGIPLGRRFRALKLWFVIRSYGVAGLQKMLRQHIQWTKELAELINSELDFELTSPASLGLLSFRFHPNTLSNEERLDELNERLLNAINDDGCTYLTPNTLRGRYTLRFSIGVRTTQRHHVFEAWANVKEIAQDLQAES